MLYGYVPNWEELPGWGAVTPEHKIAIEQIARLLAGFNFYQRAILLHWAVLEYCSGVNLRGKGKSVPDYDVEITEHEVQLLDAQRNVIAEYNGRVWYSQGQLCRATLERKLGAWPGYLDGIEASWDAIRNNEHRVRRSIDDNRRQLEEHVHNRHIRLRRWRSVADANPPNELGQVSGIRRLEISDETQPGYVYFLISQGKVVYVGQTSDLWPNRIYSHLNEGMKEFDDVWYLMCDVPDLNATEKHFITLLEPKYNLAGLQNTRRQRARQKSDAASLSACQTQN